jgi:hypothetical protein
MHASKPLMNGDLLPLIPDLSYTSALDIFSDAWHVSA